MEIKQISVFLENNVGRLGEVTQVLAGKGVNLRAISIADTKDFGILRLIVNDHSLAQNALNEAGFTTRLSEVVAIEIDDKPGSLSKVIQLFSENMVNIEYLYASLEGKSDKAVVIFKLENYEKGLKILNENRVSMINSF